MNAIHSVRGTATAILLLVTVATVLPFVILAWRATSDTESDLKAERLHLAQLAAAQADRILVEAFFELELASVVADVVQDGGPAPNPLRTLYGRAATFNSGILLSDADGNVLIAEPDSARTVAQQVRAALGAEGVETSPERVVSEPFIAFSTGHVTAALRVPVFNDAGDADGSLVGLIDLTEPLISGLVEQAELLGASGHADLVDERGLVLASTEPRHIMTAGEHPSFYRRMAELRTPTIDKVRHEADDLEDDASRWHVMAYVPLRNAPWGIAMGASEEDTFDTLSDFRRNLVVLAFASIAVLLVGGVLIIRRIPA